MAVTLRSSPSSTRASPSSSSSLSPSFPKWPKRQEKWSTKQWMWLKWPIERPRWKFIFAAKIESCQFHPIFPTVSLFCIFSYIFCVGTLQYQKIVTDYLRTYHIRSTSLYFQLEINHRVLRLIWAPCFIFVFLSTVRFALAAKVLTHGLRTKRGYTWEESRHETHPKNCRWV